MISEYISKVDLLVQRKQYAKAKEVLNDGLLKHPQEGVLYAMYAEVHLQENRLKEAMASIDQAIGLEPETEWFYYTKGRIAMDQNDLKLAHEMADTALLMDPEDADFYGLKALIYLQEDKFQDCLDFAEEGLVHDAEHSNCLNMRSIAQNKLGQGPEALQNYLNLLEKDPDNEFTHANIGYYFLERGDIENAKRHFSEAVRLNPNFEMARSGMSECLKASNFLYRKLLQFAFFMERIGSKNSWLLIIGLVLVVQVLPFLAPFYLVFIFWSWFTGPITDIILYRDKYGRFLMSDDERKFTRINVILLITTGVSLLVGIFGGETLRPFLVLAFGSFLSLIPVYLLERQSAKKRWILYTYLAVFLGMGFYSLISNLIFATPAPLAPMGIILGGVIMTWTINLLD